MLKNPSEAKLINASKISGRTKNGLGVGILNAVTQAQFATIENIETGEIRKFETNPTTNYNLFVLDQTFKHNSSVSFINTNVTRGGNDYNANVSAALFSFNDKKNTYNISGNASTSYLKYKTPDSENSLGYSHTLSVGKTSGRFNFNVSQSLTDTKYNSNDLGYFTNNNFINHNFYMGYRYTEPKGWYNRLFFNINGGLSNLYSSIGDIKSKYQNARINFNVNAQTKKLIWFGAFANFNPAQNDFYEPRNMGHVFRRGKSVALGSWIETNAAKKYSVSAEFFERIFLNFYNLSGTDISLSQKYRFNSKFSIEHQIGFMPRPRSLGYTTTLDENNILFAIRKVSTVDNVLNLKYSFTNKMGLTFRARHYVSVVDNKEFYTLNNDGSLSTKTGLTEKYNRNVNYFNIDMVYTWQFAPGSFLNIVWKDAGFTNSNIANTRYFDNFQNTLQSEQNNNLSLKVIYFLDYLQLKRKI